MISVGAMSLDKVLYETYKNTKYSGYLGLAPFTNNPNFKTDNLMYQLKDNGFLTHNVVSFYFRGVDSIVKFGNYDKEGLKDPS